MFHKLQILEQGISFFEKRRSKSYPHQGSDEKGVFELYTELYTLSTEGFIKAVEGRKDPFRTGVL